MKGRFGDLSIVIPFVIFTSIWGSTWIVIRDQLGTVPPQWSVAYRFAIAAVAMAAIARWKGDSLKLPASALPAAAFLGFSQFCVNFNFVYLAERHITSGVVATFFALLVIPNALLGWAFLGQRPSARFAFSSLVAVAGIGMLFAHEISENAGQTLEIAEGLGLTLVAMLGASASNVFQARPKVQRFPLFALLAWAMAIGALIDAGVALAMTGPPVIEARFGYWIGVVYLALFASALAFSLYFPVVRRIGPAKAAYSSVLVPIIAMAFSTWLEAYRWTPLALTGAVLALAGMVGALSRSRSVVPAPDAA